MRAKAYHTHRPEHPLPVGGWQIIYTGFALIMLSFFILLTSFASLQQAKITRFVNSFSSAVTIFQHGRRIEPGSIQSDGEVSLMSKEELVSRLFEQVRDLSAQYELSDVQIRRTEHGVVMTLSDTLLFESGKAQLTSSALPLLLKIGGIIARVGHAVEIEGHTDNIPIHSDIYPSNWELSTARAINVLRFLMQQEKISPKMISASGRSEYQPLVPNDSATNRAINRRVAFIFGID